MFTVKNAPSDAVKVRSGEHTYRLVSRAELIERYSQELADLDEFVAENRAEAGPIHPGFEGDYLFNRLGGERDRLVTILKNLAPPAPLPIVERSAPDSLPF